MTEKLLLKSNTLYGAHAAKDVFPLCAQRGYKRIAWIIDQNLSALPYLQEISDAADKEGLKTVYRFESRASSEPDYDYLDQVAAQFRPLNFDVLIGIGGGTACDIAKAVGILMTNDGSGINYRGMDLVQKKGIPIILMPSTAGTGTEVTHTASFNDLKEQKKLGINGRFVETEIAALDPMLTLSCPLSVTLSSGLDAMLHAVEAVTAKTANTASKMIGGIAFQLLYHAFPKVVRAPDDLVQRTNMLLGSHFAGLAMANVGGGPASGISYPLGVCFKVPHGIAGGVFLQHAFAMNVAKGYTGYAYLNDLIDPLNLQESEFVRSQMFSENFSRFYQSIGAPTHLARFGITKKDIERLVELTMTQREANLLLNPVPFTQDDVRIILDKVIQ